MAKYRKKSQKEGQACNARTQKRHAEEWSIGQEGEE